MQNLKSSLPRTTELALASPYLPHVKPRLSSALRGALVLAGLLGVGGSAHADTIATYNHVSDYIGIGNFSGASTTGNPTSLCSVRSVSPLGAESTIRISAWSAPASGSTILGGTHLTTGSISTFGSATLASTEDIYTRSFNHSSTTAAVGIYTKSMPSSGSTNPNFQFRNYRVQNWDSTGARVTSSWPKELVYTNVVNNGTYTALPSATDPTTSTTFPGFQGTATPVNPTGFPVDKVYLSLQQPNGLYWGGPTIGWSHLQINHEATRSILNSSTKQVKWTVIGNGFWPSGANLPAGKYTLRTMARSTTQGSGGASGPGRLNTIEFNIVSALAPSSSSSSPSSAGS